MHKLVVVKSSNLDKDNQGVIDTINNLNNVPGVTAVWGSNICDYDIIDVKSPKERRIFYIDVGSLPPEKAKAHVQSVKEEIQANKSPLSLIEDYFFTRSSERKLTEVVFPDSPSKK